MILRALVAGFSVAVVLAVLSGVLWRIVQDEQRAQITTRSDAVLELTHELLESRVGQSEDVIERLAARSRASVAEADWRKDARHYLKDCPGLVALVWRRADKTTVTEPSGRTPVSSRRSLSPARAIWGLGTEGLTLRVPTADGGVLIAEYDATTAFDESVARPAKAVGHVFSIIPAGRPAPEGAWTRSKLVDSPFACRVAVSITPQALERLHTTLPTLILACLLTLSFLGGAAVSICFRLADQARELKSANQRLEVFNRDLDQMVEKRTNQVERARIAALNIAQDAQAKAAKLQVSESTLRSVLHSAADGILLVDGEHRIRSANPATAKLFQRTETELIGQSLNDLVPVLPSADDMVLDSSPLDALLFDGRVAGLRPAGETIQLNLTITRADGSNRTVVVRDLTRWIAAESRFKGVVESAPSAIVMINRSGSIVLVNSEAERLFGYERSELVDRPIEDLVPVRYRAVHPERRTGFFESPESREMGGNRDLFALRKDGTEIPVEIGLNPIETEDGLMALSVIVDITERKNAERALQNYALELEAKNQDLDSFAHAVSHDLKAPLRGVTAIAQWTMEDYGDVVDEEGRANLTLMVQRCDRLNRLVDGILEYSRIGRSKRKLVAVDTNAIFAEVVACLEIPENVDVRIEGELPSVSYDSVQFEQVAQNLVSNGIKYIGDDGGSVEISCRAVGTDWEFCVGDTGVGIDSRHFEKIFEVFRTLNSRDTVDSTGVGLSLVKRIVEIHGGRVWVESTVGEGSSFFFSVPSVGSETAVETPDEAMNNAGEIVPT